MQRKLTVLLASVVLLIALVTIVRWSRPAMPLISPAPFAGLGQRLAVETIKAVNGHGKIVVVISAFHQLSGNPAHAAWESFQSGLKKNSSVSLTATEVVGADPDELVIGSGCSGAQLQAILTKYAAADAIVFLIGLPEWGTLQSRGMTLPPGPAKIIVAVDGAVPTKTEYGGYFSNRFLAVLVTKRPGSTATVTSRIPPESLDQYYQVYTPQNADTLPE